MSNVIVVNGDNTVDITCINSCCFIQFYIVFSSGIAQCSLMETACVRNASCSYNGSAERAQSMFKSNVVDSVNFCSSKSVKSPGIGSLIFGGIKKGTKKCIDYVNKKSKKSKSSKSSSVTTIATPIVSTSVATIVTPVKPIDTKKNDILDFQNADGTFNLTDDLLKFLSLTEEMIEKKMKDKSITREMAIYEFVIDYLKTKQIYKMALLKTNRHYDFMTSNYVATV